MTTTDQNEPRERITDEMLDEMLENDDASALFHGGELFDELRHKLADRILDAEMKVHLDRAEEREAGNTRNGHNVKMGAVRFGFDDAANAA